MPTRRNTPTGPTAAKPSVVVPLQKVLYNSEDPTLELDGLVELVIKDERQLQPGVSWTAGSFATEQTLTVLCGNHIIKAEGAFSSLTLQYPSSASFTNFLKRREAPTVTETGASTATGKGRAGDGNTNTLQVFFASHDDYSETASELEKLKILKPAAPLTRPHSVSQIPTGLLRPLSAQLPRPSSAQLARPSSAQPRLGISRQNSGFHPGRFLSTVSYHPSQRNSRCQPVRRAAHMPPPAMRISPRLLPKDRAVSHTTTKKMASSQEVNSDMSHSQYAETTSPYFPIDQNSQVLGSQDSFDSSYGIYGDGQEYIDIARRQTPIISYTGQRSTQARYLVGNAHMPPTRLVRGVITPMTPPAFRTEAEGYRPDRFTPTSDHLTHLHWQGGETDYQRLLRCTRAGFPTTTQHQPAEMSPQNYINILTKGMEHPHATQQKLDAVLTANKPNSEAMKGILAEYADEFGRIWGDLCKEGGP
ncbi:hypothetical protein PspLS_06122 [Pyricularia sp. CBS 133598]|nr:hypothetical protein PspLS_06122 [Pyricularia sp. CBS 133598]